MDDLLDEFYPAYFGEAAGDMRSIYEELEEHMLSQYVAPYEPGAAAMYPIKMLDDFLARVAVAKQKVSNPTILARVERDKNGLKGTWLWANSGRLSVNSIVLAARPTANALQRQASLI